MPDAFTFVHRAPIILAAVRNNVPAVYWDSDFAREGGLLSYGADTVDTSGHDPNRTLRPRRKPGVPLVRCSRPAQS
jgi:hypothetical protein